MSQIKTKLIMKLPTVTDGMALCNFCGGIGYNADAKLLAAMKAVGDPMTITCPKCKGTGQEKLN